MNVSYRIKVGDEMKLSSVFQSSLTIQESFLQTLASINSMESFGEPSITNHKPYVFVVGTHKDRLLVELGDHGAERRISEINDTIKVLIKDHGYGKLVLCADKNKSQIFFAVDNTCENDDIFHEIR